MPRTPADPPHGIKRYRSRTYQCRCAVCKESYAEYMRGYRLATPSRSYGRKPRDKVVRPDTPHGYKRYRSPRFKCRCPVCKRGHADKTMEERKERRASHSTTSS